MDLADDKTVRLPPSSEPPGRERFGRFELIRELGRGGMGCVYEAYDAGLERTVALKVLSEGEGDRAEARARFQREARLAARLQHRGLLPIHEVGEGEDGRPYFTMELIQGQSLAQRLEDESRPLSDKALVELVAAVSEAAGAAHAEGLIHRDIKPGNVLLDAEGRPYLADFGLAKDLKVERRELTRTGTVIGTVHYLAPEQVRGDLDALSPRTDVWALGVLLYRGLVGELPFEGETLGVLFDAIQRETPPPPSAFRRLPRDLETIVLACLEKAPARRYADGDALAADLRRWAAGQTVVARRPGPLARAGRWAAANKLSAAMLLVACVSLALGLGWQLYTAGERRRLRLEGLRDQVRAEAGRRRRAEQETRTNQRLWPATVGALQQFRYRFENLLSGETASLAEQLEPIAAVLAEQPQHPWALWLRGLLRWLHGQTAGGLADLDRAIALDPGLGLARLVRAQIHLQPLYRRPNNFLRRRGRGAPVDLAARLSRIRQDLEAVQLGSLPLKQQAHLKVAWGALHYLAGRPEKARELLLAARRQEPRLAEVHVLLGLNALRGLRNPRKGASYLLTALQLGSLDRWLLGYLGQAYHEWPRYDRALMWWQARSELGGKLTVQQRLARISASLQISGSTRRYLTEPLDTPEARVSRGMLWYVAGRKKAGYADLREAVRLAPDAACPRLYRAICYEADGKHREALAELDRALQLYPGYAQALVRRAAVRQRLGLREQARSDLDAAIAAAPRLARAHQERALLSHREGKLDAALADYQQAARLDPGLARAHLGAGMLLYRKGREAEGRAAFERAREADGTLGATIERWLKKALPVIRRELKGKRGKGKR